MTATSKAPRRPRIRPRGPPPAPTPIRTARGARTAAADERVLAEFLEASLRVPDLSLPPRKRFSFPPPPAPEPDGIPSHALVSGDADAEQRAIAAAAETGAFRVTSAVDAREARDAVEAASELVFAAPEEVKRGLERWYRRRDREPREEFVWFRPMSADEDRAMAAAFPGSTYRAFRYVVSIYTSFVSVFCLFPSFLVIQAGAHIRMSVPYVSVVIACASSVQVNAIMHRISEAKSIKKKYGFSCKPK
jgi:hypothetical protein